MTPSAVVKLVGSPSPSSWAQVYNFVPTEEEKREKRGELVAVLAAQFATGLPIEEGREILARLHEEYFGVVEGGAFAQLQDSVKKVSQEFAGGESPLCQGLEIVACVLLGKYIYFCVLGEGRILLYRGGRLVTIAKGGLGGPVAISGEALRGDTFLLGTKEFFEVLGADVLQQSFREGATPQEIADTLAPVAAARPSATLGAAIFQIEVAAPLGAAGEETLVSPPKLEVSSVLEERQSFLGKGIGSLRDMFLRIVAKLPEKGIYIKSKSKSQRRTTVSVGIILLALLIASIIFGLRQKGIREYRSSYVERLTQAQTAYSDSLLQKDVDPTRSRELFLEAKGIVDNLLSQGIKDGDLSDLVRKLESDTATILGRVEAKTSTLIDLSLVRSGIGASEISIDEDTLSVLDSSGGRIISVSASGKGTTVIAGPEKLKKPHTISIYSGRYFSVGEDGVVEIDKKGNASVVVKTDSEWGEIAKIGVFGSNVYLLDRSKGAIWRYSGAEGGFGARQAWLGNGVNPDFSKTIDITIDGSIWVLSQDGKITKFTRGAPESFRISGLEQPLSNPTAIYTNEELDGIYILDAGNKRVLELNKKGEYQKQYTGEDISLSKDLVVSKKEGKILLLTETKVLEIPLQ
ncbi:MAG: hypothetical protein Q7S60_04105 [bacterium]|nr:hypothetical protein [bacterium]